MIIKLLLLHFLADFVLQTREMGKKKSESNMWLAGHLAIQYFVFLPFTSLSFSVINCLIHGLIDFSIWRGYKLIIRQLFIRKYNKNNNVPEKLKNTNAFKVELNKFVEEEAKAFKFWEDHLFYTTIGFDQLLHALTLVILAEKLL